MKRYIALAAVVAASVLASGAGKAEAAGGSCVSDGVPSDATYVLVCFTGCKVDGAEQLWHVARASFDADVQAIMDAGRCSSWYYWDGSATRTYAGTTKAKRGKG